MNPMMTGDAVWRRFLGNLPDYAIVLLDEDGIVAAWSEGARILKGYTTQEIVGTHFSCFSTPESRAVGHPQRTLIAAAAAGSYQEEGWRVRKDKSRFWAHIVINAIYDETGTLCGFGKVLRDLTRSKSDIAPFAEPAEAAPPAIAGGRRSFEELLRSAIAAARRHSRPICVAMIDPDKFTAYNDEFGRQAGDTYLTQASLKWRTAMRVEDFIGRTSGAEFMAILPDTALDDSFTCLERLRAATPPPLTCSAGLSQWDGQETPQALLARAALALRQAKSAGGNRVVMSAIPPAAIAPPDRRARQHTLLAP